MERRRNLQSYGFVVRNQSPFWSHITFDTKNQKRHPSVEVREVVGKTPGFVPDMWGIIDDHTCLQRSEQLKAEKLTSITRKESFCMQLGTAHPIFFSHQLKAAQHPSSLISQPLRSAATAAPVSAQRCPCRFRSIPRVSGATPPRPRCYPEPSFGRPSDLHRWSPGTPRAWCRCRFPCPWPRLLDLRPFPPLPPLRPPFQPWIPRFAWVSRQPRRTLSGRWGSPSNCGEPTVVRVSLSTPVLPSRCWFRCSPVCLGPPLLPSCCDWCS